MNTEVKYENFTVRRDKNRLLIRWHLPGAKEQDRPELALVLTKDDGIEVDRGWLAAQDARRVHQEAWNELLDKFDLPFRLQRLLAAVPPPETSSSEPARLAYLRDLARGMIDIPGLGIHGREQLKQAMQVEQNAMSKRGPSDPPAHRGK